MTWKKIARWAVGATLAFLLVASIALLFVLRSGSFHRYVLAKVVEKAQGATGSRVEIGDYIFHWSSLHADVYRLAIHGTEPDPTRPLFATDHFALGLKIISVFRGRVDLSEIVIDHPVVHLLLNKEGLTNIPQPKVPTKESKPLNVFDLAIKRLLLHRGEIYLNDSQLPLDAELHNLQAQIQFDPVRTQYDGSLRYRQGRLEFGSLNPLRHDLDVAFNAAPSGLKLDRIVLTTGSSRISARANLTDYTNPRVEGTYEAVVSTEEVGRILKEASLPVGLLATNGSLRYQSVPSQPFLEGLSVDGRVSGSALAFRLPEAATEVRAIRGRYRLEKGNLDANDLQADLLGGHLTADFAMHHLTGVPDSRVTGSVHAFSLNAVSNALRAKPLQSVPVTGRLEGKAEATWRGSMQDLKVRSDAVIAASSPSASTLAGDRGGPVPITGAVHLNYDDARNLISLSETSLRTPHTNLHLNGTASHQSSLDIDVSSDDLHELDVLALSLRAATTPPSPKSPPLQPLGLHGSASLRGQVQGSIKDPRFAGRLMANNLQFQGTNARQLRTEITLSSSEAALHHGELETSAQARILFDAGVGLRNWSYTPSSPINARVSATRVPVGELARLANLQYPITGVLTADISLHGSQLSPAGQGSIQLTQARAWDQPIQSIALQFQGSGNAVHSTLALQTPAGNARGSIAYYPQSQGYEAQIEARDIKLDQVQAMRSRDLGIRGTLTISGQGRGTFKEPQLELVANIPQLQVHEQKINVINAHLSVANQHADLSLDSQLAQTYVKASGSMSLTPDYYTSATLDTQGLPLGPLLASYLPGQGQDFRGQTEVHASLKGPLKDPARLEAHVEIPTLTAAYQSMQIANAVPIRVDYRNGVLNLERTHIKGTDTELELQATVPLQGSGSITASALGTVDLKLIQMLNPEMKSSGQVRVDISARGDRAHPNIQGQVRLIDAAFQAPGSPLGAEKVNGEFAVRGSRVDITQFSAQTGGGTVSARGFVTYQPQVQFNVSLDADNVRLRYPQGMRALLHSKLALTGTPQSARLDGQVLVNRLSFTKSFDLAGFVDQFTGQSSSTPSPGFAENLQLDIGVKSADEVNLASSKLSLQGSADLRVRGTAAEPVILGRANLTAGEAFFLGHRYEVQSGVFDFANPVRTEPTVNLTVTTTIDQYNLSLNLVGPIDRLRTTYTSDPALPSVDIINLLAFGQTTEAAAASPSTPAGLGAESLLAQGLSSQVSSQVEKLAGISYLSFNPLLGGNAQKTGAQQLAIQQRVTKNLLFTFGTDITSTQGQTIQVEYQFSRKWSVSVIRDQNGGVAVDARMKKTF
jgi:translocation and assembly module TamB